MKKVESGVHLPNGHTVHWTISTLVGDNPVVHQCCGLKQSLIANHPCTYCKASLAEIRSMTKEDMALLRTPADHDNQVAVIKDADEPQKQELSTAFSVTKRCVVND